MEPPTVMQRHNYIKEKNKHIADYSSHSMSFIDIH